MRNEEMEEKGEGRGRKKGGERIRGDRGGIRRKKKLRKRGGNRERRGIRDKRNKDMM